MHASAIALCYTAKFWGNEPARKTVTGAPCIETPAYWIRITSPQNEPVRVFSMRCFFNLVSEDETMIDDEGVEVRNIDQAWAQALKAIAELRAEAGSEVVDWERWSLQATDANGNILFAVKLTHGLH